MVQKTLAAIGDFVLCPIHGMTQITSGHPRILVQGRRAASVGDTTSCGATITSGATKLLILTRPFAREGDRTSHGGTILRSDRPIFHEDGAPASLLAEALDNAAAQGLDVVRPCPDTNPDDPPDDTPDNTPDDPPPQREDQP